jgi:hypothetical protein
VRFAHVEEHPLGAGAPVLRRAKTRVHVPTLEEKAIVFETQVML